MSAQTTLIPLTREIFALESDKKRTIYRVDDLSFEQMVIILPVLANSKISKIDFDQTSISFRQKFKQNAKRLTDITQNTSEKLYTQKDLKEIIQTTLDYLSQLQLVEYSYLVTEEEIQRAPSVRKTKEKLDSTRVMVEDGSGTYLGKDSKTCALRVQELKKQVEDLKRRICNSTLATDDFCPSYETVYPSAPSDKEPSAPSDKEPSAPPEDKDEDENDPYSRNFSPLNSLYKTAKSVGGYLWKAEEKETNVKQEEAEENVKKNVASSEKKKESFKTHYFVTLQKGETITIGAKKFKEGTKIIYKTKPDARADFGRIKLTEITTQEDYNKYLAEGAQLKI
jgi:hypothetical protein